MFKFDDGVAREVLVTVGLADDSYQEVKSGLNSGERIITGPDRILRNLEDGDPVQEDLTPDENEDEDVDEEDA